MRGGWCVVRETSNFDLVGGSDASRTTHYAPRLLMERCKGFRLFC